MKKHVACLLIGVLAVSVGILAGCSSGGSSKAWTIKFQDAFERSSSTTTDLGSTNWVVDLIGATGSMQILSGLVAAQYSAGSMGIAGAYQGSIDYASQIRISVKFRVAAINDTMCGLFLNVQVPTSYAAYQLQVSKNDIGLSEFNGTSTVGTSTPGAYSITANTWYTLEMESNGTTITGRLYDLSGNVLASTSYTDSPRTYMTGQAGFFDYATTASSPTNMLVNFDLFTYEVYE